MAKLPLEKQIEKAAKEQQKAAREVAMRQRASTIVNSQPIVDGVRILDTTAALVLKCLVEQCKDVNSGHVSFRNDTLPKAVEHSVGLEIEKLIQYGMVTSYIPWANGGMLNLLPDAFSYVQTIMKKTTAVEETCNMAERKVFVSHATKDVGYVKAIVELLEDIGLTEMQMVCSSIPGYGIPFGEDIYDWLRKQFQNCELHVLFVLSKNYYSSAACLNEMGAAWVLRQGYDSILLPGFEFSDIRGAVNPNQISIKLDGDEATLKHHLNELKDKIVNEFGLHAPSASKWERHRDAFVEQIRKMIAEMPIKTDEVASESEEDRLTEDAEHLLVNAAEDSSGEIVVIKVMGGCGISTNGKEFLTIGSGPREEARWFGVIDELEGYDLIRPASYKREVFTVTRSGYEVSDRIIAEGRFADVGTADS